MNILGFYGFYDYKGEYDNGQRYGTQELYQEEHPPPYHILPRGSYLSIPQDTPDLIRCISPTILFSYILFQMKFQSSSIIRRTSLSFNFYI